MATVDDRDFSGKSEAKQRAQAREREDDGEVHCVNVSPKFVKGSNLCERISDTDNYHVDLSETSIGALWRKMGIVLTLLVISVLNNEAPLSAISPSSLPSLLSSSASPVPLSSSDDTIKNSLIPQPSLTQSPARIERQLTKVAVAAAEARLNDQMNTSAASVINFSTSSSESQHSPIQSLHPSSDSSAPAALFQLPKSFSIADIHLKAASINPTETATSPSSASGSAPSFVAKSSSTSQSLPLSSTSQSISSSMFNTANTVLSSSLSSQQQQQQQQQQPDASLTASSLSSQQQQPDASLATYSVSSVSGQSKGVFLAEFPPTTMLLPRGTMRFISPSKMLIIQHLPHQNNAKENIPITAKDNSPLPNIPVALLEGASNVIQKNSEATKHSTTDDQQCSCEFAGECLSKGSCVYVVSGLVATSIVVVFLIGWFLQFIVTIPSEWMAKKKPVKLGSIIIDDPLSNTTENVAFLPSDVESVTEEDGKIVSV